MSNVVRHKGVMRNTGSRVFVVFRELPGEPEYCLVVFQYSLPEVYTWAVRDLVSGPGQNSTELHEIMNAVGVLDGRKMLNVLHEGKYLRKVRTADVDMHTGGNNIIPLNVLNERFSANLTEESKIKDYNPFNPEMQDTKIEEMTIVSELIKEAQKYEKLSKDYYERLYNLEPSMRPQGEVKESEGFFSIEFPNDISQTKAIEKLKKVFLERKNNAND